MLSVGWFEVTNGFAIRAIVAYGICLPRRLSPETVLLKASLFFIALLTCMAACAASSPALYTAVVSVQNESSQARSQGAQSALARVLVRVSGNRDIAQSAGGGRILDQASSLLQQYGYKQIGIGPSKYYELSVTFDAQGVDRALHRYDLPVWGTHRPETMVWVAIDGNKLLSRGMSHAAMRKVARERGISLLLPAEEDVSSGRVSVQDVLQGNESRLGSISRSYAAGYMLVGQVRHPDAWRGSWQLVSGALVVDSWRDSAPDLSGLLANATNHVADAYAQRFAIRANGPSATLVAAFGPVEGAADYARISRYLTAMTGVKSAVPLLVSGETVVFRLQVDADPDAIEHGIQLASWLTADSDEQRTAAQYAPGGWAVGYQLVH